ncbi:MULTISPECIES: S1C family serine protease [Paenibacillus]|uniref:S1C family serine protease n=1 Tax=Paenibacillus TaxID=44249 RepID=UPI00096F7516|nr:trypsin-like peptidase domain-containing protein [Paenibacillus odorifer]OMD83070.1 trypsin [Paenibacillus odorifer]
MRSIGEKLVKKGLGLLLCGVVLSGVWSQSVFAFDSTSKVVSKAAAEDPIPGIIKSITPSVVGIIGKDESGGNSGPDDRYNLTHGSGIIVKSNGWIVTNAHVIKDLQNAIVVTSDSKTYTVKETYLDEVSDLALIKINATHLKPAKFIPASGKTVVGEKVIAIGTPISFSLRNSATVGVISGLNREVDAAYRLIQSDTAINPGNSGGPLVNMKGEVLGINSLKYSAVGVENMGFSIPANTVQYIMNQLLKYGEVQHPSLGLELEASWSTIVGLPTLDPLSVTKVVSSEALKSGVAEGDVLYSIDGHRVVSLVDINELFKSYLPGATVRLVMQSDGDIVVRKLVLTQGDPLLSGDDYETDGDEHADE